MIFIDLNYKEKIWDRKMSLLSRFYINLQTYFDYEFNQGGGEYRKWSQQLEKEDGELWAQVWKSSQILGINHNELFFVFS